MTMVARCSLIIEVDEVDNGFVMLLKDRQGDQRDPERTIARIVAEGDLDDAMAKLTERLVSEVSKRLQSWKQRPPPGNLERPP